LIGGRRDDVGFEKSHRDDGNRPLNVEGCVIGNETSNVEAEVGTGCRVINRLGKQAVETAEGLKLPDQVSEVAPEHHPDESGQGL
jgi:hypothetical protein